MRQGRDYIARHGETVFNAARRLQGEAPHTPLTRAGFAQADAIGRALRERLGERPALTLWSSPAGRALQTLAIVAEHLGLDWHAARTDPRLTEIGVGSWGGLSYAEVEAAHGPVATADRMLRPAPDGEPYAAVAMRLAGWIADTDADPGDRLVLMHGVSSRVLRGLLTGAPPHAEFAVPVALGLAQGSVALVMGGSEAEIHRGRGGAPV